jgi:DNA-binding MarR family transcriptional regulator
MHSAEQDQIGPELADIVSRLRRAMRRAARAADPGMALSVAQLELLSSLAENPGARPGEIARMLRLAPSSVATLLNALGSAGLITRSGRPDDRRAVSLHLSGAGAAAVRRWQQVNESIVSQALLALPSGHTAALADAAPALRDLTTAIDALADDD